MLAEPSFRVACGVGAYLGIGICKLSAKSRPSRRIEAKTDYVEKIGPFFLRASVHDRLKLHSDDRPWFGDGDCQVRGSSGSHPHRGRTGGGPCVREDVQS